MTPILHSIRRNAAVAGAMLLLASCGGGGGGSTPPAAPPDAGPGEPPSAPPSTDTPTLSRSVVLDGLANPWDLAFTPDGALLFTEKCNGLSVRLGDGTLRRLFGAAGSAVVADDFFCRGQSGMLGVAVDPTFATNRLVYVFMQSNRSTPATNRVVRLRVNDDYTNVTDRSDIVTDIPFKHAANAHGAVGQHSGGRLRFGPDGFLHVTTGDNHAGALPQDRARLGGKVLRVDRNGAGAPGNNTGGGDARVFTRGHRNVQGIAFRPTDGRPYACEHGPGHSDEVTPLAAGGNGGWDPQNRSGLDCADGYCGYAGNADTMPMTDTTRFGDALRPVWVNQESQGVGPCTFVTGPQWRAWHGRLLVGVMADLRLDVLHLDDAGTALAGRASADLPRARYRALVQGPDGQLYVATDGGEIWRVAAQ